MERKIWTEAEKASVIEVYFKSGDKIREYAALIGVGYSTFGRWLQQYRMAKNQIDFTKPSNSEHAFVELICAMNERVTDKVTEPLTGVEIKLPSRIVLTLTQVLPATLVSLVQEFNNADSSH